MGKTLKTVAIIAAAVAVAVFAPEIAPLFLSATATAATTAATVATITAIGASIALSTASMALFGPKIPKTQMSRLNVSLDPSTPRKAVFGTTAMPLDLRYHESSGTDQEYVDYIVAVAAHKVGSIDEIWFEEKLAWTANGGATATYAGYLTVTTRTEGSAANYISINGGGKWGSSRRLTGCAYVHLRIKRTGNTKKAESPLVNGLPSRVTIIGDGARLYDPRKDSTVPGGSGSHRATDQATWGVYTDADDTDNPVLQLLWWLIGWQINGKLSVGCGVPYNRIDMASFITAANICDENVTLAIGGTQKRYRTSGTASDADDRLDIINNLLASMNGTLRDNGGKLTVTAMKNDLANYVLTFNESDMLGGFDWQQTRGLTENYNIVRGRYVDPSPNSLYQMVDYPEIELAVSDGIERVMSLDLPYVEDGRRAQRIAKQVFQRNQYRGMFSATFNAKALGCQVGNVVRINLEALGWVNKLFRVVSQEIRFDGQVPMALVEENAAIYAWDAEDVAPITPTAPTIYNPLNNPFILGLAAAEAVADGKIDSYYQASAPTGATEGDYWTDTDDANKLYRYTTGVWTLIRDTGIPAAITAAAGAQATADGKVTTFYVETTPTAQALGDLWYKPSTKYLTRWNGTAWADVATVGAKAGTNLLDSTGATLADAAIITSQGTAANITGQAATATSSDFSVITGTTKPANNATVGARAGTNIYRSDGTTVLTQAEIRTAEGTAAAITGQAATATSSDFSVVTGTTKPENNATIGAVAGTNLKSSTGTVLGDAAVITSQGTAALIANQGPGATAAANDVLNNRVENGVVYIGSPVGGSYSYTSGLVIGAIKIVLPVYRSNTMMRFFLDIYDYNQGIQTATYEIGGYNYSDGSWYNVFATKSGPRGGSLPVRFGHDGVNDIIWIGDGAENWNYPNFRIRNFQGSQNNVSVAVWDDAWGLSVTNTARTNVTNSVLVPRAGDAVFGEGVLEAGTGGVIATLPNFKTAQGTAAAIAGQAATATSSDFSVVTGTTKPANNATVGARAGTNIYRSDGTTVLSQAEIRTAEGTAANITGQGPGATAVANRVLNDRYEGLVRTIAQPDGGQFYAGDGQYTGQLQIALPFGGTSDSMISFEVNIYDYETNKTVKYIIGGYQYINVTNPWWTNVSAQYYGPRGFARPVKFGSSGGLGRIWIGNVGDTWNYSIVSIKNLQVGFRGQTLAWESGWTLSLNNSDISGSVITSVTVPRAGDQVFGEGLFEVSNGAVATLPNFKTAQGTAAAIAGQAATATNSDFSAVTGTTKPSDNATSDIRLVGTGTGIVITGNRVTRPTGGGDWTAQAYTPDGYIGGAYCSFSFETNAYAMAGLDSSPTDNASYSSIDFCWYCPADSTLLYIYESGANPFTTGGAHNSNTVLSVVYDNEYVRYLKDGVEVRAVYVGAGKKYHFDSSIVQSPGITNIRFGPYAAANAPLSFINTTGHTSEGNTVFKRSNATNDWDGKSISREISQGTAFVTGKLDTVDTFIALHEVGNTGTTYSAFSYSFHRSSNGTWAIYEDGGSPLNLGTGYDNNTQWSIRYDGVNVRYYAGTTLLRTVASSANRSFQAGVSIFSQNSRVSAIQFGPYTDRSWSNIAGSGRPADNATVGAVAGTNLTDVSGNQIGVDNIRNNMALIDWWKKGATIPWSQNAEYNVIGSAVVDLALPPPVKGQDDVWFCQEVSNNGDQGGGWNGGTIAKMDPDKTYRFVLPIRNRNGDGTAYWGTDGIAALNTTTYQSNPYFCATGLPTYDRWYLFVGYIYPRNSTSKNSDDAGVWDCKTGTKYVGGTNYCFLPDGTQPTFRAYQYYASNGSQKVFGRPLINLVDGTEPDLRMYFEEGSLLNNQQRFDEIVAGNGKPENNADVTLTAQITTQSPDDVIINADYLGAIIAGQFNKITTPIVTKAGSSVRTDNRATYTATNITGGLTGYVTMNNTTGSADKGRATITNCTSSGSYNHNIFWDGVLIVSYLVKFTVVAADPPLGGGGSGGTGNKSGSFDSTGFTVSSTSFAVVGTITNLTKAAGETIRCSFPSAEYQVNATTTVTRSIVAKWQYSATGANSWTDVGTAVTGTASSWDSVDVSGSPGSITVNQNVAPANAAYDLRLVAAMNTSGNSITFQFGTASVLIGV